MRPTPYVASLRIFEPLSAFEPADRLRWSQLDSNNHSKSEEQARALARLISPQSPALALDGAHVLEIDGEKYISPWSTATRCWAALEDFKNSLPAPVSSFFLPKSLEEVIESGAEYVDTKVPHILTQTWIIPPRWFILFSPEERTRGTNADGLYSRALTSIAYAKQRCDGAHDAVVNAFGEGPVEQELENLLTWLEMFHPESLVELDYGGLANYMDKALRDSGEEGLESDSSIEDVTYSVAGLSASDGMMAGVGYQRLMSRWRLVQAFEQAS